jgi:thiol-disulfide isomerase/thioredoxin
MPMSSIPQMNGPDDGGSAPQPLRDEGPSGLLIMGVVGVCMLVGILFLAWLGTPRIEPAVGQTIAKLDLSPIAFADAPFSEKDLQGKITVLHFWGTWCPSCRQEFPEFVQLANEFKDNAAVQIISISSSEGPEYNLDALAESTKSFLKRYAATVPTYADPAGLSRVQVAMLLPDGSLPYPCTVVLDRQGVVAGVWLDFTAGDMAKVAAKVRSLL